MAYTFARKYATLTVTGTTAIRIPLVKRGVADYALGSDYSPSAGDVKVSIDGASPVNVTNLPTAITYGNTALWELIPTAAETTGKSIRYTISDSATKAIEDETIIVETFGHASAMYPTDFSAAVLAANLVQSNGVGVQNEDGTCANSSPSTTSFTFPALDSGGIAIPDDAANERLVLYIQPGTAGGGQTIVLGSKTGVRTFAITAGCVVAVDNTSKYLKSGIAPLQPTVPGNTLDVSATGEGGLDFSNIKDATGAHTLANIRVPNVTLADTVTTATNLTNAPTAGDFTAAMKTSLDNSTPASVGSVDGDIGGNLTGSVEGNVVGSVGTVNAIAANAITAAAIATDALGSLEMSAGAANEIALAVLDMAFVGHTTAGTVGGVLGSLTFTVPTVLDVNVKRFGDVVGQFAGGRPEVNATHFKSVSLTLRSANNWLFCFDNDGVTTTTTFLDTMNAAAQWDLATTGHTNSGTFGAAMVAAGGTGDPWATVLGGYGANTAGKIIYDNINAAATRAAVGLAAANLDTQLAAIASYIDTEVAAIYARLGAPAGASLAADIASKMAAYTQPTGFLAATFPASPAAVGSPMTLADASIKEATFVVPAATVGRPTGVLGWIRRLFEDRSGGNKRDRNRTTGVRKLYDTNGTTVLQTSTQATATVTDSETQGA